MSEYWVSKKQYWCKYCSIWVRDDAPSKALHEGGFKHQGNKERFIRDIYKTGVRDKRAKEDEARMIAQIEASAKASHASKDGGAYAGRLTDTSRPSPAAGPSSKPPRPPKAAGGDKFANYSNAAQMGFDDDSTKLSSYEIEQMVGGRVTNVGEWEEVTAPEAAPPAMTYGEDGTPALDLKRKADEEEDHDNFKFEHRDKRPVHDVYDEDDWDPKAVLGGIRLKTKERKVGEKEPEAEVTAEEKGKGNAGFNKAGWSGKLDIKEGDGAKEEAAKAEEDGIKSEEVKDDKGAAEPPLEPAPEATAPTESAPAEPAAAPSSSMFKKRRPPPSRRK